MMGVFVLKREKLAELMPYMKHLAKFEGMVMGVRWEDKTWKLSFSHEAIPEGHLKLHPAGVHVASTRVHYIYTPTGKRLVPHWTYIITFDGELIDITEK